MATDAARLAAYRKLEGRSSVISSSNRADDRKSLRTSVDRDGKSPRTSRELRRMSTERKRALRPPPALERSVWEDSPRSSIQSFIVARPYRHSDCAISLLPAEILGHVFELLATEMPPRAPGGALDQIGSIGWIAVSHVCRHWREISLGMAKMWAQSVGTLTAAAETMLERAQGTPITLSLNDSHRDALFHTAHLHFAKSLIIDLTDTSYSSNVLYAMRTSLAMQPLPTLETLSIVHAFGEIPPHNFDLQPIHAPSLRCISMENYFLPWHSLALTDLTLARTKTQMESHPSFSEILKLLRSTPTLQRLSLRNWIPETGALSEGEQRVSLPFLARIEIRDRPAQCTALWSALAVPASARIVIAVDLLGVAPAIAAGVPNTIFRALGPHYRVPHAAPFEYVALTDCRGDSFLRMRAAVRTDKASTPMPSLSVDFWPWRSPRGITGFQHALAAFALHVGVAHVRTLALDCSADDDVGDAAMLGWREALEPMAALRSLEIHDRAPLSLSRALGYPDVGQVNGEPARKDFRRLLLPGLHSLILRPCPHRRRDEARVLDWMVLCNSLRQRTETNRALRQLQLYGYFRLEPPTPTRKFQDELDNVVIEISWDI